MWHSDYKESKFFSLVKEFVYENTNYLNVRNLLPWFIAQQSSINMEIPFIYTDEITSESTFKESSFGIAIYNESKVEVDLVFFIH